jgi:hypothetical protein
MSRIHQQDELYTVMSGSFFVGAGDQFDDDRRLVHSDEPGSSNRPIETRSYAEASKHGVPAKRLAR